MIKAHLKSWKKAFEKDHLRIKKQNEWFDDFKNESLPRTKEIQTGKKYIYMYGLLHSFVTLFRCLYVTSQ